MARKKTLRIVGIGVGVLLLGGAVSYSVTKDSRNRIPVQTEKVGRHDLTSIVSASGEVKPKRFVNISSNVSGRIVRLLVREGDAVHTGQVLARIDSLRFEAGMRQGDAALQAAKADLERDQADLRVAQLAFERNRQMHGDKLVSDQVFDQAEADLKMKIANAEAQKRRIAQQEAILDTSKDDLEKTTVVSSMDGVVTSLDKEEGEMVIGAQSFSPTVIMTVGDLSVMECEIMVDETDIRNVKLGQKAEVRVDALEGIKISGEVTEIGSSAIPRGQTPGQTTSTSTNTGNQAKDFKVKVTLKDPPKNLRPGLNATADITTATREKVVAIPIQAVVVREMNKAGKVVDPQAVQAAGPGDPTGATPKSKGEEKEGVFVLSGGQVTFRPVKVGIVGETEIEVLDGIKEREEIITGSYKTLRTLKDQAKVKMEKKEKS